MYWKIAVGRDGSRWGNRGGASGSPWSSEGGSGVGDTVLDLLAIS